MVPMDHREDGLEAVRHDADRVSTLVAATLLLASCALFGSVLLG